ncbi:MAG: hypothetical protein LBF49_02000 [Puniceicoccales bacterium]|nr:hypothetical protein [Puniceicoccales bacterium]
MSSFGILFLSAIFLVLFQSPAFANFGIPMIVVIEPILILLLIPVIIMESLVMARTIKSIKFSKILCMTSISNLVSTIFGFPIMWLLMTAVELGLQIIRSTNAEIRHIADNLPEIVITILQAPWVAEGEILGAYLFLMIPFFFLSWWIEYAVAKSFIKVFNIKEEQKTIKSAVFKANIASYIFLSALPFIPFVTTKG